MDNLTILPNKQFDYVNSGNPTVTVNPESVGVSWLNITSGELFVCIDNTAGANRWRGQLGTEIYPESYFLDSLAPHIWLDLSDASTIFLDAGVTNVATDGDLVYEVKDKSGNAYDWRQASSGNRPTYKPGYYNGLDAIRFDGVDDYLPAVSSDICAVGDFVFFFVYGNENGSPPVQYLFDTSAGRMVLAHRWSATDKIGMYDGAWKESNFGYNTSTEVNLLEYHLVGGVSKIYRNRVLIMTDIYTPKAIGGQTALFNGYSSPWASSIKGALGEFFLFEGAMPEEKLLFLRNHLQNKWGMRG